MKDVVADDDLIETWTLPHGARLGSAVRSKGIFLEIRSHLAPLQKPYLSIRAGELILRIPANDRDAFEAARKTVSSMIRGIERLAVLPREVEDILAISTTERRRWLEDGRLPSMGTRTVKFRGRAKQVTFHVFDPRLVEDVLNQDLVSEWRELDTATAAENRRFAVRKPRLTRPAKSISSGNGDKSSDPGLIGWEEFAREGPLR
jgi:hypothetical protein